MLLNSLHYPVHLKLLQIKKIGYQQMSTAFYKAGMITIRL